MNTPSGSYLSGIDRPTGRSDAVTSGITGGILRYFTPDPLPDLLARCVRANDAMPTESQSAYGLALALAGPASLRHGKIEHRLAALYCDVVTNNIRFPDKQSLILLGQQGNSRGNRLRREMVYADALIPTMARQIYAHHDQLPELLDSLWVGFRQPNSVDGVAHAAVTGFFCAQVHPFLDGNGRWSRLVAAAAAARVGRPVDAMLCALYLNLCKDVLTKQVWPATRAYGLRAYIDSAHKFTEAFSAVADPRSIAVIESLNEALMRLAPNARLGSRMMCRLYSHGELPMDVVKHELNLSSKVVASCLDRIGESCGDQVLDGSSIKIQKIWEILLESAKQAKRSTFN